MVTTIAISEQTKARFDNAQRILSVRKNTALSQDDALSELLEPFEATLEKEA